MKRTAFIIILLALLAFAFISTSGCVSQPAQVDVGKVREYADPMAENILLSLTNNDYGAFTRDFDQTMKDTLTQARFDQLYSMIKTKVGDYVSKEYLSGENQGGYITVHYKAKYANEPAGVAVNVSFKTVDSKPYVAGLWFDSPRLRAQ